MSDISEDFWCAGWLDKLEYTLWGIVEGGNRSFGMGEVRDEQINGLKKLSQKAGGWWRYDDSVKEELFITIDEWKEIYSKYIPDPDYRELSEEEFDEILK